MVYMNLTNLECVSYTNTFAFPITAPVDVGDAIVGSIPDKYGIPVLVYIHWKGGSNYDVQNVIEKALMKLKHTSY